MFNVHRYNPFLFNRYIQIFGKTETDKLLKANENPAPKAIRINTLKTRPGSCIKHLEEKGFAFSKIKWCKEGYFVKKEPFSVGSTPEYLLGHYYVQDATSMAPPIELSPEKDETVLDMAAAPGGKTTHLAQIMKNTGAIMAVDMNKEKIRALRSNIQRMDAENVLVLRMKAQEVEELGIRFDKILLDAPCTAEGTIRKNPERRKTIDKKEVKKYSDTQKDLIKVAKKVLRPDGILLYSTCSTLPEEDELNVEYAVEGLGFKLLSLKNKFCSPGLRMNNKSYLSKCGRFYPHVHNTQGFFIAKLKN